MGAKGREIVAMGGKIDAFFVPAHLALVLTKSVLVGFIIIIII